VEELYFTHATFYFFFFSVSLISAQWRIQEFQKGDAEQGLEDGSPPAGFWVGAPVGVCGRSPQKRSYGHYATFTTHNKRKLQYKDIYNTTKTGHVSARN